ncbi:MAG: matrixin family metalloprotease [Candidatus Obscuribacterales bacterium]|nr:matrixin family metalloprotease [Candidatus Obscuribacterales bacterium]
MPNDSQVLDELRSCELNAGIASQETLSITARLSLLEHRVFGCSQQGGILQRLSKLKLYFNQAQVGSGDALPLLNAFPPRTVRMAKFQEQSDYLDEVKKASKNKSIHFKLMPVPIFIQPYPNREYVSCVTKACQSWETASNGIVSFVQVSDSSQARVRILWKHLGGKADASGCLLGAHTILNYKDRGNGSLGLLNVGSIPVPLYIPRLGPKYQVPPQVMEINLDLVEQKDPTIRCRCLQNIVTHELGHALGLLGHSPSTADMMHSITDEHSRISERDVKTLKRLYEGKVDIPL